MRGAFLYFWKKNQWECYDLVKDPEEMHNIYDDPAARAAVELLKQDLFRLKKEMRDDDRYAEGQPADSSDVQPPPPKK